MNSLQDLVTGIVQRERTAVELLESYLEVVKSHDDHLRCFLSLDQEAAQARAAEIEARLDQGQKVGPLAGLPIALKDNICVQGRPTTCASKILKNFVAPYSSTVWERLEEAGAVLIGKTNLDEFAMGSSTENSAFGPTRNPWDPNRVPGGSSGGSAACVAAQMAPVALGSDTGGSIRQPAALCGVTGFKPTYGRVSRYGLVAFASSLDQIGPLAKSVEDCETIYRVIAGHDPRDSTSARYPLPPSGEVPVRGLRFGIPRHLLEGLSSQALDSFERCCQSLESAGARPVEIELPHLDYSLAAYYVLAPAEASSNLARYDGVRYGFRAEGSEDVLEMFKKTRAEAFGPEVKRRIMLGTYTLSSGYYDAYYLKAQKARTVLRYDFEKAFGEADLVVMPATPTPAFRLGEKSGDPMEMYLSDIYTVSANLVGLPGLVVPGPEVEGLPYGFQMLAPHWEEERLFAAGRAFQQATDYHLKSPDLELLPS